MRMSDSGGGRVMKGIKLRKAKLKPTNSSVEEGEVDIW